MKDHVRMQRLIHKAKEWRNRRKARRMSKSKRESSRPQTKDSRMTEGTIEENTVEISTNYHTQEQSPLFASLPGEVRVLIWTYALAPTFSRDDTISQSNNSHQTLLSDGSNEKREPRCYTSLLLTCRRIWSEAHHLGLEQAEPTFNLFYPTHEDHDGSNNNNNTFENLAERVIKTLVQLDNFLRTLTQDNRKTLKVLRIRTNLVWLRDAKYINTFAVARGSWPVRLTVEVWCQQKVFPATNQEIRVAANCVEQAVAAGVQDLRLECAAKEDGRGELELESVVESLRVGDGEWKTSEMGERRKVLEGERVEVKWLRWMIA